MALKITPITERFGAECSGIDISRPLSEAEVKQITDAMDTWGVTVWRGVNLTDEQHVAFSRYFGFLEKVPRRADGQKMRLAYRELFDASNLNLEGEITTDKAAIEYRKGDRLWHTDSAFLEKRTSYSILSAHDVPPPGAGGETWFADARSAYEDLPEETKAFIEDKIGINSLWWSRKQAGAEIAEEEIDARPKARHPIMHTHRGSGRKSLFIAAHTMDIEGMDKAEGRKLIADLIAHTTQAKYTISHNWQVGDLVIWDNLATMHKGGDYDYTTHRRDMRRTTVREGTEPHLLESGDDPYTALFAQSPKAVDINAARDAGR